MILKEREVPRIILQLKALLSRLPQHHTKIPQITLELNKRTAGFKGEQAIDYPLSFLDEKDYYIFHDLRLRTKNHFFQIDTLILTKNTAIILEVKNFSGTIYFDSDFKQLIQSKDGIEKGFTYPLTQLERQEILLREWLLLNKLNSPTITSLVVISNSFTIIRTSTENKSLHQKIIHKEELPYRIVHLVQTSTHKTIEEKDLKKISRVLLKHHTIRETSILDRYQIKEREILKGTICKECGYLPLNRMKGNWYCPYCKKKDKLAHVQALNEYKLLFKPTITNAEVRHFLVLSSGPTANRLLHSMNLRYTGENKSRLYYLE
ncbi:MAG TPA: nuclease-related domain-containing protein [Metabacillus sp.]|nr:nuclease-related domain-containing protein [Metabacillus sp.]